jgi:hypothetical protein
MPLQLDDSSPQTETTHFPTVSGSNLDRHRLTFPDDLAGELNVILIAFQQWQQAQVNTWLPLVRDIEARYRSVRHYELPTIERYPKLAQMFINEGMRAGIPDPLARERTVTLYLDKDGFRRALAMADEDDIYVLVVDRQGVVRWRSRGTLTEEKAQRLEEALASEAPTPD